MKNCLLFPFLFLWSLVAYADLTIIDDELLSSPQPQPAVVDVWQAKAGATLSAVINEWGKKAGWDVVWNIDFDYPIQAQLVFEGSFLDVIVGVFRSYETAERPLLVDVYEKQHLIVITERGTDK
jgi:hypothetical protein